MVNDSLTYRGPIKPSGFSSALYHAGPFQFSNVIRSALLVVFCPPLPIPLLAHPLQIYDYLPLPPGNRSSAPPRPNPIIIRAYQPRYTNQLFGTRNMIRLAAGHEKGNSRKAAQSEKTSPSLTHTSITAPCFSRLLAIYSTIIYSWPLFNKILNENEQLNRHPQRSGSSGSNLNLPFKRLVHKSHFYIATAVVAATYDRSATVSPLLINGR